MAVAAEQGVFLLVNAGGLTCALPISHVVETMRPLPVEKLSGAPGFVRGVSVIRGAPTPVVDLAALLGRQWSDTLTRFVTLRLAERRVALGVDAVLGTCELSPESLERMPPLVGGVDDAAGGGVIKEIGVRDERLLLVLRASRVVPDGLWETLAARGGVA
jgi:purine-binding chemotaxis protein CheW